MICYFLWSFLEMIAWSFLWRVFALPFLHILKPECLIFFFPLIFHLPIFNFHGKEEKMLSALFPKPVLWRQLNWLHCVPQESLPYSFPKLGQQNFTWYRGPPLQTQFLFQLLCWRKWWNMQKLSLSSVQNTR